jgi:GR25 family glycosyltransferase involved in LPS biosynthesis
MKIDKIFYINLEQRIDRRQAIEVELGNHGFVDYERFPAIYHPTIGGVGCGRSHVGVLRLAKERGHQRIMILEDDFMFTESAEFTKNSLLKVENLDFDVCLISYHLLDSDACEHDSLIKIRKAQTTSGYIVNQHYYDRLIQVFEKAAQRFEETNHHWLYAIDIAWNILQDMDTWYGFSPRLGKQRPSHSDCSNTFSEVDW